MSDKVVLNGEVGLDKVIDGSAKAKTLINGQSISYLGGVGKMQAKEVVPSAEEQIILPDDGFIGLQRVTVGAIPHNYGLITWSGLGIRVS